MTMMLAPGSSAPPPVSSLAIRSDSFMPLLSIQQSVERRNAVVQYVQTCLVKDHDYGSVGGMDRPTLLKPGAEKLNTMFGLTPRYELVEKVEDWTGQDHGGSPFFYYWFRCQLWRSDMLVAEQDGSCNSHEKKYRWRWVAEADIPSHQDKSKLVRRASTAREPDFGLRKRETTGKYGKPAAYWDRFERAIADGTARKVSWPGRDGKTMTGYEIADVQYRVPNDDVAEQVNTILKMSQKRALIAATLVAVNASEFFTQDVEDLDMIEGDWRPGAAPPAPVVDPATGEMLNAQNDHGLSRDEQFLSHWDALADEKKLHQEVGRRVLSTVLKKRKIEFAGATDAQRGEILDAFRNATPADIDKIRKLAEKQEAPPAEAPTTSDAAPAETQASQHASEQQKQQQSSPTRPVDAKESDYLDWFDLMLEAGIGHGKSAAQVLAGVQKAARLLQKAPEEMTETKRAGLLAAARANRFNYETGIVMKVEDAKL